MVVGNLKRKYMSTAARGAPCPSGVIGLEALVITTGQISAACAGPSTWSSDWTPHYQA